MKEAMGRVLPQAPASGSTPLVRSELAARLQARRPEIEEAILARVYGVSDPRQAEDPTYIEGLKAAVVAAISFGLDSIGNSERNPPQIPPEILVQARIAARNDVSLDTVLRRYFAGYALLGDFLIEEGDAGGMLEGDALKRLLRVQASIFDRLLVAVSEEYRREEKEQLGAAPERKAKLVEKLLAGERIDTAELSYELEANHLGAVANGQGAAEILRELAHRLDRRLLTLCREEDIVWAWLGGRRAVEVADLERAAPLVLTPEVSVALGEPGEGLAGWRLTHQQARAAMPIALHASEPFVRYADVALLASVMQDELLATSLRQIYLAPLELERDGGKLARKTLRAYFSANRNTSSAAASLGISRQAAAKRLASIEERLGDSSGSWWLGMEVAILMEECRL